MCLLTLLGSSFSRRVWPECTCVFRVEVVLFSLSGCSFLCLSILGLNDTLSEPCAGRGGAVKIRSLPGFGCDGYMVLLTDKDHLLSLQSPCGKVGEVYCVLLVSDTSVAYRANCLALWFSYTGQMQCISATRVVVAMYPILAGNGTLKSLARERESGPIFAISVNLLFAVI